MKPAPPVTRMDFGEVDTANRRDDARPRQINPELMSASGLCIKERRFATADLVESAISNRRSLKLLGRS